MASVSAPLAHELSQGGIFSYRPLLAFNRSEAAQAYKYYHLAGTALKTAMRPSLKTGYRPMYVGW